MGMLKRVLAGGVAIAAIGATASGWAQSQRVTFTKDVMPILQENCQTCHRPLGTNMSGMIAPMSLMTYQEVRPWAKSIAKVVASREMPPWHASEEFYGHFDNERVLTQDEIDTIVTWVKQRAPRGNPQDAPEPVDFPQTGWNLGEPDLVVDFPEPFFVEDEVEDLYHNITTQLTEEQHPEDRWVKWIEFKPGSEVVHHIIGYAHGPDDAAAASAEEGEVTRGMLGGNAPGTDTSSYPEGFGVLLPEKAYVTFAMHYHKEPGPGTGVWDSSQMGIKFQDKDVPVTHPVEISTVAHGAFEIPPYADNWKVGASRTFHKDTLLLAMMPHMHLRGKSAKYVAYYPDGTSEVLLDVPKYDFNWQSFYDYGDDPKLLPAGTRIEMELVYDNSQANADRVGFNPARAVSFGGPTTDEMDLAWVTIAPAEPTDQVPAQTGD